MKKYRIVKTENGHYLIQKSFFFGLFWKLASEPIASYSEYNNGYEFDINSSFSYNSVNEAMKTVNILKNGTRMFYRKHKIRLMKTCSYNVFRNFEYRYFVTEGRFNSLYTTSFTLLDDAKSYIDKKYKDAEDYGKNYKVKEVVKYC